MTKFTTLNEIKIEGKKTILKEVIDYQKKLTTISDSDYTISLFKELIYIGKDMNYGDTFIGIKDNNNHIWIMFGEKGDEFNDTNKNT